MRKLRRVGFFRELRGKGGEHGSLVAATGLMPEALRRPVAAYLRGGAIFGTTGRPARDYFDASKIAGVVRGRTDGQWWWTDELAYYVEVYGVSLPEDFVEHMRAHGWRARGLDEPAVIALESEVFGPDSDDE